MAQIRCIIWGTRRTRLLHAHEHMAQKSMLRKIAKIKIATQTVCFPLFWWRGLLCLCVCVWHKLSRTRKTAKHFNKVAQRHKIAKRRLFRNLVLWAPRCTHSLTHTGAAPRTKDSETWGHEDTDTDTDTDREWQEHLSHGMRHQLWPTRRYLSRVPHTNRGDCSPGC